MCLIKLFKGVASMTEQNGIFPAPNESRLWNRDFVLNLLVAHLLLAGFFSLFIVPTTYLALDKIKKIDVLIDIFKK